MVAFLVSISLASVVAGLSLRFVENGNRIVLYARAVAVVHGCPQELADLARVLVRGSHTVGMPRFSGSGAAGIFPLPVGD